MDQAVSVKAAFQGYAAPRALNQVRSRDHSVRSLLGRDGSHKNSMQKLVDEISLEITAASSGPEAGPKIAKQRKIIQTAEIVAGQATTHKSLRSMLEGHRPQAFPRVEVQCAGQERLAP